MSTIGQKIQARRKQLGMSLNAMGRASGLSATTTKLIERGSNPSVDTLERIAEALETTVVDLISEPKSVSGATDSLVADIQARRLTEEDVRRLENVARAMFSTRP